MQTGAQKDLAQSDAGIGAALEAALSRVSQQAKQVVMTARLATALHMCQVAESTLAQKGHANTTGNTSSRAVPDIVSDAAQLVRRGYGR